ncbi:MAG: hypothetical protein K2X69_09215 [Silvanigrellaceae bacterium]|nr:hypothetical protein [Silvanigrellaceae bacterium]
MKIKTDSKNCIDKIDFNLNAKEAFILMLDDRRVIDKDGYIFSIQGSKVLNNFSDTELSFETFLDFKCKFAKYVEKEPLNWGVGIDVPNANLSTILSSLNDIAILFHQINYEENRSKKLSIRVSFSMIGDEQNV